MRTWRLLPALAYVCLAAGGCGGDETAVGKGGFDFSGGGGSSSSGGCTEGGACVVADKLGECAMGTVSCNSGEPVCAGPSPRVTEVCDGLDDSCDGVIDNGDACPASLEAIDVDGAVQGMAEAAGFPVNGKASQFAEASLGAAFPDGWLRASSASPMPLGGTWVNVPIAGGNPHILAPTLTAAEASANVVVPFYRQGDSGAGAVFSHSVLIVNASSSAASVTIQATNGSAARPAPAVINIAANGSLRTSVPLLFGTDPTAFEQGFLQISSDQKLAVAYEEARSDAADASSDSLGPAPMKELTLPYFVSGPSADTELRFAAQGGVDANVTVRAHLETGQVIENALIVPASSAFAQPLAGMFGFGLKTEGWLEITSDQDVALSASVFEGAGAGVALFNPTDGLDFVHWIAGGSFDVAAGARTDVSLANPGAEAANVTLQAFAADGSSIRQTSVVLGPGAARISPLDILLELPSLNGWVRVVSDRPITGAYITHDATPGVGITRLHHGFSNEAIVPDLRSFGSGLHTEVTLIQPERSPFGL